ncbi:MAG TPA: ribonuclease H-like domain-containing protein [Candidatus Eisenbacteria bacterium]|nr:ribonuclease H-like domain-containing protein [Candidatus Eisenbacteria bacterium]
MLSKTLRARIGDLFREEAPAKPARKGAAAQSAAAQGAAAQSAATNGAGANGAAATTASPRPAARRERTVLAVPIEEVLSGGIVTNEEGSLFVHERLYTDLGERPTPLLRRIAALDRGSYDDDERAAEANRARRRRIRAGYRVKGPRLVRDLPELAAGVDPPERGLFRRFGHRRLLYLDIETCGLSGVPVFLVGLGFVVDRNIVFRQLFARDYAEERALLFELSRIARDFDALVTFNGKTFDAPFLQDRAVHHRVPFALPQPHLDLLWMARRRWKAHLPNCRLQTLEWRVLRRRRGGDVDGSEIPGHYHDYVKRGEAHRLVPVFHHNLLDVVAMVELTPPIFDPEVGVY